MVKALDRCNYIFRVVSELINELVSITTFLEHHVYYGDMNHPGMFGMKNNA